MKSSKKCQVPLYIDEKSIVSIVTFISSVGNGTYREVDSYVMCLECSNRLGTCFCMCYDICSRDSV